MIEVREIRKSYRTAQASWKSERKEVLKGISMEIREGRCVGLIGESGSGKSTLSRMILGLEKPDSGEVRIEGMPVKKWCRQNPGKMSVVFQDCASSVNPRFTVRQILLEAVLAAGQKANLEEKAEELLKEVNLPENLLSRYPHELSGGQLQRVCIARAISTKPRFLVLDEAVSSLDVSVQAQILKLLARIQKQYQMTYLFIAHDLQAVTNLCDELYFLLQGELAEHCEREKLSQVQSVYAKQLLASVIPFTL